MRNSAAQAGEWTSPLTLSIVVPFYNDEEVLPETLKRLEEFLERPMNLAKISRDSEIVLVDDGSHDGTWALIRSVHETTIAACAE